MTDRLRVALISQRFPDDFDQTAQDKADGLTEIDYSNPNADDLATSNDNNIAIGGLH